MKMATRTRNLAAHEAFKAQQRQDRPKQEWDESTHSWRKWNVLDASTEGLLRSIWGVPDDTP